MLLSEIEWRFLLNQWLDIGAICRYPRYQHLDPGTCDQVLSSATRLAEAAFAPHAARSDANEPTLVDGRVRIIPELAQALKAFRDAGLFAMGAPIEEGGTQLPHVLRALISAQFSAANAPTYGYAFLTQAAASLLRDCGNAELRARYLPKLVSGEWFGTMCLSEPHAGSSLSDIKTLASPQADGSYRLRGNKMWISGGAHELASNIIHCVLARTPGAPAGAAGISLFLVPRYRPDDQGAASLDNGVQLQGLNHKMGYRGTVNTLLSFGESVPCVGHLLGQPQQGLAAMFRMMNEARIGVGIGAAAIAYAGYRLASVYARERRQGRPMDATGSVELSLEMCPIRQHPDVRHMLLRAKALSEGALALCLYGAALADQALADQALADQALPDQALPDQALPDQALPDQALPDQGQADQAQADQAQAGRAQAGRAQAGWGGQRDTKAARILDLLTPVIKAWSSHHGCIANDLAIQVHGGYGYTRDFAVERLYRDNRLNPIHEGSNGIQGLDLLARKVLADQAQALQLWGAGLRELIARAASHEALHAEAEMLADASGAFLQATAQLMSRAAQGEPATALCHSSLYLDAFGTLVVATLWLQQALAAQSHAGLREAKLQTCKYFFAFELPRVTLAAQRLADASHTLLAGDMDWL